MTSALSIMALALYKQFLARGIETISIEQCEAMLRAAIDEATAVGEDMEKRAREREHA